jgi:hypothetical protein
MVTIFICFPYASIALTLYFFKGQPRRHTSGTKADPGRTCSVTFVQTDGTTYSNLIFPGGSTSGLLDALTHHLVLKRYH